MSPVLRALVDADNQRPGPSDADRKRVYAALGVSLGVLPVGIAAAAHAAGATATATAATASGSSAVATAVGAASTVGRIAILAKAPLVSVGAGAVLGAALTAYVVKGPAARWTASARARRAAVTATAPARATTPVPPTIEAPAPVAMAPAPAEAPLPVDERPPERPSVVRVPAAPHHVVAAPAATRDEKLDHASDDARAAAPLSGTGVLAQEQALLDPARVSLAHGDGAGALARLAQHEHRFPNGALAQEREAMTIRALVITGDRDAARARAQAFRSRYPSSLLWPMIAASLDAPLGPRR
jgi:hypothetical protein